MKLCSYEENCGKHVWKKILRCRIWSENEKYRRVISSSVRYRHEHDIKWLI